MVLLLKRAPGSNIDNCRPITLISTISKLMKKIIGVRISKAAESSLLVNESQNGFREGRTCSDNIFILNTMIEAARREKKTMHVLFVDLAEAYDWEDRKILLYRLSQLGFPIEFLDFLKDYYNGDNISSKSGGKERLKQYLLRGLRQGCNLSSILFILYITELVDRLEKAGVGSVLRGKLINSLFFCRRFIDSGRQEDLNVLIKVLERWCQDFKMKVSIKKNKIVGPNSDSVWVLKDHELNNETLIEMTPII